MSYAAVCCSGAALAYLDVKRGNAVKVITAELQTPHMTIAANPVIDGNPVWTAEKMHEMTTAGAAERHVTEIAWSSHRSWVIRCGQCPKQVEVSDRSLGAVAAALCRLVEEFGGKDLPPVAAASLKAYGFPNGQIDDYVASDGQVRSEIPLGVLNRILTNING